MNHNRGFVVGIILAVIALVMILALMGFFRADGTVYGLSFKETLHLPCGLKVYQPKPKKVVVFPLTVRGYANGCGWIPAPDNRLGILDIVSDDGVYYGSYILRAKGDVSKPPYYFEGTVDPEIPYSAKNGTFIFTPNFPQGKTVKIPVLFQ